MSGFDVVTETSVQVFTAGLIDPTNGTRSAVTVLSYVVGLVAFLLIMLVLAWCSDEGL
jgi:hypothetical protein